MSKQEILAKMLQWEQDNGESFTDYFNADIKAHTYMTWCLGRKYITPEKYNEWLIAYGNNELDADDPNYFVYNDQGEYGPSFAVVYSEEYNQTDHHKAYGMLAEFFSEITVYQKRLAEFFAEYEEEERE
jgi:hypothetical protein